MYFGNKYTTPTLLSVGREPYFLITFYLIFLNVLTKYLMKRKFDRPLIMYTLGVGTYFVNRLEQSLT